MGQREMEEDMTTTRQDKTNEGQKKTNPYKTKENETEEDVTGAISKNRRTEYNKTRYI